MTGKHARPGSSTLEPLADLVRAHWKAIIGFVTPGLAVLAGATTAASDGGKRQRRRRAAGH